MLVSRILAPFLSNLTEMVTLYFFLDTWRTVTQPQ
ncbi:unnamed protein product [Brassica oleracea var. botrytis]